jgi:membrane protein implicated in regulation of membrane protease activity
MIFLRPQTAILAAIAFAGAIAIALWRMRRLSLRVQFLVLLSLGVSIGFVFMTVVQVPDFPRWLAAAMVTMVFIAAPFATRTFMRSLKQEEQEQAREPEDNVR